MRLAIVVAVVSAGCNEHGSHLADASMDRGPCETAYQASLDRTCTVPADCGLAKHDDCCGTVFEGVRAGTEASAQAAETTYGMCFTCPPVGCAHADLSEDGKTPQMGQAIVADCVANRCTSTVR